MIINGSNPGFSLLFTEALPLLMRVTSPVWAAGHASLRRFHVTCVRAPSLHQEPLKVSEVTLPTALRSHGPIATTLMKTVRELVIRRLTRSQRRSFLSSLRLSARSDKAINQDASFFTDLLLLLRLFITPHRLAAFRPMQQPQQANVPINQLQGTNKL